MTKSAKAVRLHRAPSAETTLEHFDINDTAQIRANKKLNTTDEKVERKLNVQRCCPSCNTMFQTIFPDKVYCTDTCQRREKGRRRALRRKGILAERKQFDVDERYHAKVANPTVNQLIDICLDIQSGRIVKPVLVVGIMPTNFPQPQSVDIVKQVQSDPNQPDEWVIQRHEVGALEVILGEKLFRTAPTPPAIQSENPKLET